MTTPEKIQKFANMLAAPDGTAWVRIKEKHNKKTWRGGSTCEWTSYDVQMLYIEAGKLMEIYWDYAIGDIKVRPVIFHTDDIDYICEFKQTNRAGVFDAFDKFFFDSREAKCHGQEELDEWVAAWREDNKDNLNFINK